MGMFDDVICTAMRCPLCGSTMGWQSKDGDCTLEQLTAVQLCEKADPATFYADCSECRIWVEVTVRSQRGRTSAQWAQHRADRAAIEAKGVDHHDEPTTEGEAIARQFDAHVQAPCANCGHPWHRHTGGPVGTSCVCPTFPSECGTCVCPKFRRRRSPGTVFRDADSLRQERQDLLDGVGLSYDQLKEKRDTHTLAGDEFDVWERIENIDWLLAGGEETT